MTRSLGWFSFFALAMFFSRTVDAQTVVIATSKGAGADAEVRDHQPTTNFGASTELATRIVDNFPLGSASDGNDRFSVMYLKFDIAGQAVLANQTAAVKLTFRNSNLTPNRIHDMTPPGNNTSFRTGIAFYGLDRDHAGNAWSESTISYSTAPGLVSDSNNGTKDFDFVDPDGGGPLRSPLVPLGVAAFPAVPPQNRLPVGGDLMLSNDALNNFITSSLNAAKPTVTIVAAIVHDGKIPVNDWKNFNYSFNPKEQLTLSTDVGYDADTNNPNNSLGSPWSSASNAEDLNGFSPFSPQLILTSALLGDFNLDGSVNAADYTVWRNSVGQIDLAPFAGGDGNGDGGVDGEDYATWKYYYGNSIEGLAAGSADNSSPTVPEPGALTMLMTGALVGYARRRTRSFLRPAE